MVEVGQTPAVDGRLQHRLAAVGVALADVADGRVRAYDAWIALHAREGRGATVLDRYVLEAVATGRAVEELTAAERRRLGAEVLPLHYPGWTPQDSGPERGDPVVLVAYDTGWPELFARWRDRLAEAVPDAVRILHVGSTAVPELAAKPVIDVQISVEEVDDETGYVAGIEAAGVALRSREEGHRYFRPSAGRPRDVQVHVCAAGSAWEREHVLFRDFLRADGASRERYAALKHDLADRWRDDRLAYTDEKSAFILATLAQAERWARATAWQLPPRRPRAR